MKPKEIVRVRDVMRPEIDIVDGMTTVSDALSQMKNLKNKMLIVDKRHEDDEYGVVRMSDIAHHVLAQDKSADRVNVYEIMIKPIITVDASMDIRYCARLFERFRLSRAPVVENGKLVGVVSLTRMVVHGVRK
ncbi:MAG: histidine kinase [Gammaproteobacteria bacterium]|nr:MAG: histidine kinase [Gammaproteobacteria bacterium]RKZ95646.1 MAG: histidine kinase [Gammaproteobacteria bacterium]RKZ98088.1 MAG: histidine kinase [Gammaproteobacteria bacterium]